MKSLRAATAGILPALLLFTSLFSVPAADAKPLIVPGEHAEARTAKLTSEIVWNENLSTAQTIARKEGKMIFWMHMLGQLDGTT